MRKHFSSENKLILSVIVLIAIAGSNVICIFVPGTARFFNTDITDTLVKLRYIIKGKEKSARELRVFSLDDKDAARLGIDDTDRTVFARMLDELRIAGCKTVIFDMIFKGNKIGDSDLVSSTRELGCVFLPVGQSQPIETGKNTKPNEYLLYPVIVRQGNPIRIEDEILPFYGLAAACSGLGTVLASSDDDRIQRRIPLIVTCGNGYLPSLILAGICHFLDVRTEDIKISFGEYILLGNATSAYGVKRNYRIPIDDKGRMIVDFTGPWRDSLKSIPVRELFASDRQVQLDEMLAGTIVLVSDITTGKKDFAATVFDPVSPQSVVLANALNTILTENYLYETTWYHDVIVSIIIGTLFIAAVVRLNTKMRMITIAVITAILCLLQVVLFFSMNLISNFALLLLAGSLSFGFFGVYGLFRSDRIAKLENNGEATLILKEELPLQAINEEACREYYITPRQREILKLLQRGYTYKKIASLLDVHEGTVKSHIQSIKEKTNIDYKNKLLQLFFPITHS